MIVGPSRLPGVPDYGVVNPGALYRGGQPTSEGFQHLAGIVKTIVSLRAEGPYDTTIVPIPLADHFEFKQLRWIDEAGPTVASANDWLRLAADKTLAPIFVHCLAGAGRTGVACALVRYSLQGWTMEAARKEILLYRPGFGPFRWPMSRAQKRFLARWASADRPGEWTP